MHWAHWRPCLWSGGSGGSRHFRRADHSRGLLTGWCSSDLAEQLREIGKCRMRRRRAAQHEFGRIYESTISLFLNDLYYLCLIIDHFQHSSSTCPTFIQPTPRVTYPQVVSGKTKDKASDKRVLRASDRTRILDTCFVCITFIYIYTHFYILWHGNAYTI